MADSSFETEFLQAHNAYRKQHGAPSLSLNASLSRSAQAWAEKLLASRTLKHSNSGNGENLYYTYSSAPKKLSGCVAVENWYSEIKKYDFNRPGFSSGTGHFTQVVWKDTKELGVGVATNGTTTFVVGQYSPAGNISNAGYFEKNVLPVGSAVDTKTSSTGHPSPATPSRSFIDSKPTRTADSSFETEFLQAHNAYRKQHGAPSLSLNASLSRSAQAWAEKLLASRTLKHRNSGYGENLYYTYSSAPKKLTGCVAVESWYSEIKKYDFNRPGFSSETGHFTQVVWKDTKELGVGVATDGTTTFVVGQYSPAGNISNAGHFEKNVQPVGSAVDTKTSSAGHPSPATPSRTFVDSKPTRTADSSFETEFLQAHNAYRKQHGAPSLSLNASLSRSAQAWAEKLLASRTLKHSNSGNGENLYYTYSSAPKKLTGKDVIDSWYSEIKKFDFNRPGFSSETGHFTQVVWKDTKELGVGVATDGTTTFVVGQYSPAGNISNAGHFEKNVQPVGSAVDTKTSSAGHPSPATPSRTFVDSKPTRTADSSFETEFLQAHNAYRKQHGAPSLSLNASLSRSAQAWAEKLLASRTLKHSNSGNGENLYYNYSSAPKKLTGCVAVESWYSEIKKFDFNRPGFSSETGHFTQVVWKDTKELGVGVATDGTTTFVVGQYSPAGNISNAGYFEKNVLPVGSAVDAKTSSTGIFSRITQSDSSVNPKLPSSTIFPQVKPSGSSANSKLPSSGEFSHQLLEAMNRYRQRHGVPVLSLCPSLCKEAQGWAAHLVSINTLKNSGKGHGETMSYKWTSTLVAPTGEETAENWYKDSSKYNFVSPGFQSGAGNFTQMIWKSTERLGVGQASDGKGMFITVAFYKPAGNITNPGYFKDNVKPAVK
ncbi:GLI pathogenesis-related 2 [Trichomycterus rosablanca]|uniref:GLI pathogenesis-related 2 n=1 Tax=Trichomycterus rosablanca TaxID=2290929 RepID=UPI002F354861